MPNCKERDQDVQAYIKDLHNWLKGQGLNPPDVPTWEQNPSDNSKIAGDVVKDADWFVKLKNEDAALLKQSPALSVDGREVKSALNNGAFVWFVLGRRAVAARPACSDTAPDALDVLEEHVCRLIEYFALEIQM
jgi:hypothetical protein